MDNYNRHREIWDLCGYLQEHNLAGIVKLFELQNKGRHRYLVTEKTEEAPFPLWRDTELLELARRLKDILLCLARAGIRTEKIGRRSICLAEGQIKLAPWRAQLQKEEEDKLIYNKNLVKILAELLLYFWAGKEVGVGWQPDESFFEYKSERALLHRDHIDKLTRILQKGVVRELPTAAALIDELTATYREMALEDLREEYEKIIGRLQQEAEIIDGYREEDLDPYSYPDFYAACQKLLDATHDNPVEPDALTHTETLKRLQKINAQLNNTEVPPVVFSEIMEGRTLPEIAQNFLRRLDTYVYPVRIQSFTAEQWLETFRQSPEELDLDQLMGLMDENISLITIHNGGAWYYLLRQKNLGGFQALKPRVQQNKISLSEAIRILKAILHNCEQLKTYLKTSPPYPEVENFYLQQDGDSIYFNWIGQDDVSSSNPLSSVLAFMLYGGELAHEVLRIPLLWEERYPERRMLPQNILDILLRELSRKPDGSKTILEQTPELPAGSWWNQEFVEMIHWRYMANVVADLKSLLFHYHRLLPMLQKVLQFPEDNQAGLPEAIQYILRLKEMMAGVRRKIMASPDRDS